MHRSTAPPPPVYLAGQLGEVQAQAAALQSSLDAATAQAQQAEERAAGLEGELEGTGAELAAAREQVAALTGECWLGGELHGACLVG